MAGGYEALDDDEEKKKKKAAEEKQAQIQKDVENSKKSAKQGLTHEQ